MRRCRHAAASVGFRIYVHGGLKGGKVCLLDAQASVIFLESYANILLPLFVEGTRLPDLFFSRILFH